jgi:Spy/CpxP family protein refolding chaperone
VNYWKVILATVVIFGAGVLTGALVVRYIPAGDGSRHQPGASGVGMRLDFLRRIQRDFDLTAEQRERIDKLLKQSQERTRKIMEPVSPLLHQELQRAKAEFREVLTSEQQVRFDELLKRQQRFREQHRPAVRPEPVLTNTPATNSI